MNITAAAIAARLASEPRCLTAMKLQNADYCAGAHNMDAQAANSIIGCTSDIRYDSFTNRRSSHAKSSSTMVEPRSIRVLKCLGKSRSRVLRKSEYESSQALRQSAG